jgi:O-succinylhomoserine sulfhydrylase
MDNDFADTLAVRAGIRRSQFNEHAEALYLTSSFVFDNAAQAAARFSGEEAGFVYWRASPTRPSACCRSASRRSRAARPASPRQRHVRDPVDCDGPHEGGRAHRGLPGCSAPPSSCSAASCPSSASRPPSSLRTILRPRAALRPQTRLFFIETPSNPLTEVFDIAALAAIARRRRAARGRQLLLHAGAAAPARSRRRSRRAFGHQVPRWPGKGAGRRGGRRKALIDEVFKFLRTAGPTSRPSTPGSS